MRTLFYQSQEGVITEKVTATLCKKLEEFPANDNVLWMILAELALVFKVFLWH